MVALCCKGMPFLVIVAVLALARASDQQDDGIPEPESDDVLPTQQQISQMHGLIDSNKDGKINFFEIMVFSDTMVLTTARQHCSQILEDLESGSVTLEQLKTDRLSQQMSSDGHALPIEEVQHRFLLADSNSDGKLILEEMVPLFFPDLNPVTLNRVAQFLLTSKDQDDDGKLSAHEFLSGGDHGDKDDFARLDQDGSGTLDVRELEPLEAERHYVLEAMEELIDLADKDYDGHLTTAELDAEYEKISESRAGQDFVAWAEHLAPSQESDEL
ncbi:unnamed protein product [Polarella glacialis]|uniref:EF-hand domain-containing protein n=1 Tax=Polarella glacialis TaxID=89957 RepID=A0A813HJY3_POLGL|nr:unnamed protein product [Polarella glacialis]